jgi:hypothetical protein
LEGLRDPLLIPSRELPPAGQITLYPILTDYNAKGWSSISKLSRHI